MNDIDVKTKRENHVRQKIQIERLSQKDVGGITTDEHSAGNIRRDELHEDPSRRIGDATVFEEICKKGRARENDRIVSKDNTEDEEKAVEHQVELWTRSVRLIRDIKGQTA